MWMTATLLAAVLVADVEPAQPEAPVLKQESLERERLFAEAEAALLKARPMAKRIMESSIARLRERGVDIPDDPPTVFPTGEITKLEGSDQLEVGDHVKSKLEARVRITEETINRFLIEATIRDSHGAGASTARVGDRIQELKPNLGSGFTASKPGKHERIYILSARSLKTGETVVLDVAKLAYKVHPAK